MSEIKFELRKRAKQTSPLWTIQFNPLDGTIISIIAGQTVQSDSLIIGYDRVKGLLSGVINQNDYKVLFNDKLGALDLVNLKRPTEYLNKKENNKWLSVGENQGDVGGEIKIILFIDPGILRVEASNKWITKLRELQKTDHTVDNTFPIYITDLSDPHQYIGKISIPLSELRHKNYCEIRLWSVIDNELVRDILYHGKSIRLNMPAVIRNFYFKRADEYFPYIGDAEDHTVMSHPGPGKHISIFNKNNSLWIKPHYTKGSEIDEVLGNFKLALLQKDDPEYFIKWIEVPALLLRQDQSFELEPDWPYITSPFVLYKANNLDIGILDENSHY